MKYHPLQKSLESFSLFFIALTSVGAFLFLGQGLTLTCFDFRNKSAARYSLAADLLLTNFKIVFEF
jgi:hypothetical protein